jgi:hypothetical protein
MSKFDPSHQQKILDGDCGFRFYLGRDFEQSRAVGGLASSAHGYLGMAVQCFLVGYDKPAMQLLEKSLKWLQTAINEHEKPQRYAPDGTEASRYQSLAFCNWLSHGQHDAESLQRFVEYEDRFLVTSEVGRDKVSISLLLPTYVDAGAYKRTLELFASTRGLSAPESLGSIRNEAQMSYIICRHRLGQEYAEVEVTSAVDKFLNRSIDDWLRGVAVVNTTAEHARPTAHTRSCGRQHYGISWCGDTEG